MSTAYATDDNNGTFAVVWDNDIFTGTDRNYTNGIRFSWVGETAEKNETGFMGSGYSQWLKDQLHFLPFIGNASLNHSGAWAFQQVMITPEDITEFQLLPDQAPYVGYTHTDLALYAWNEHQYHEYQLTLGVVGPDSGAENTQKFIHKTIGADKPNGWGNQVTRQVIVELTYTEGHKLMNHNSVNGHDLDLTVSYDITLGNYQTRAIAGGMLRYGKHLKNNFNVYYSDSGSESALIGLFDDANVSGWQSYIGLYATGTAYSYIEEEIKDSHQLNIKHLSGSLVLGAGYFTGQWEAGFSLQANSSPVRENDQPISFGSLYFIFNI